jgi:dephospho-CoA kinase
MNRLYGLDKKIIGLTGGIATGKSSFSKLLTEQGHEVICADQLIKEIYEQEESIKFIQNISFELVVNKKINFKKLREFFFNDQQIKNQIEDFLYPKLEILFLLKTKEIRSPIIYDIPLLFEKNLQDKFDYTVLVYASKEQQIERLCKRDNLTLDLATKIIGQQKSIETKRDLADLIIENTRSSKFLIDEYKNKFIKVIKKY